MKIIFRSILLVLFPIFVFSQSLSSFELSKDWLNKIKKIAPKGKGLKVKKNILIFSLHTGYEHWSIPHTEAVMKLIAEKSNDFNVTLSREISVFEQKNIKKFDAIILNNNCSDRERRNLLWDALKYDSNLNEIQRLKKAKELENNLLNHVKNGNGIMILHGGIVMQNNSRAFSKMAGGSFDFHPVQQDIHVKLVDPNHPLVKSFDPIGFVHYDEPYFFNNDYLNYNFRPLLYIDLDEIKMKRERPKDKVKFLSWIKKHGAGRVFYSSPSHNAQSMEDPKLLSFFLNGLYYVVGAIECDDSPIDKLNNNKFF
jgi:type 1 glutamine amidotransferase